MPVKVMAPSPMKALKAPIWAVKLMNFGYHYVGKGLVIYWEVLLYAC